PETDAERAIVLAYFPEVSIEGRFGRRVVITYEGVQYSKWLGRVRFSDITKVIHHNGTLASLKMVVEGNRKTTMTLPLYLFSSQTKTVVDAFAKYYGRHLAMKEYVRARREQPA